MTVGSFIGEEPVSPVLLDGAAHGDSVLGASVVRLIDVAEGIGRLDVAVAQISEGAAMELVGAGFGDDVDHPAGGLAVFRRIAIGEDLELLHGVLRNGGANAVDGIVDGVGAVNVDQVAATALTADVQAGSGSGADTGRGVARELRIRQCEVDVVAAVDRQVVDARLVDGGSGGGLLGLNQCGFRGDGDGFSCRGYRQLHRQLGDLTDGETHRLVDHLGEAGSFDGHRIQTGRER